MKYSEAKKAIESLSSKYSVNVNDFFEYFDVNYKGLEIAYVDHDERYVVDVWNSKLFSKLPFSNKLYMIMSELAMTPLDERVEEKKYNVKVPPFERTKRYYYKGDKGLLGEGDSCNNQYEFQQFTADELKEYGLDDDMFEKVEVKE